MISSDKFDEDKEFNSIEKENIKFLSKKKDDVTKEEALDAIEKKYRNKDFIIAKSGTEELTKADIGSLTAEELRYALNEIYARRGRKYESADLDEYFRSKSWYSPVYSAAQFSEDTMFNDIEKKNVAFLSSAMNDSKLKSIVDTEITAHGVAIYTGGTVNEKTNSLTTSNSTSVVAF